MQEILILGQMVRNLHYWSTVFLLWITFLHMVRVVFTRAYRKPRHTTCIFGILLFILVVLTNFTGYLLSWDQLSYWAITVSTSLLQFILLTGGYLNYAILGGDDLGGQTLANFFNLHTGIIPILLLILMVYHLCKIRNNRGVIVSEGQKEAARVDVYLHLVVR